MHDGVSRRSFLASAGALPFATGGGLADLFAQDAQNPNAKPHDWVNQPVDLPPDILDDALATHNQYLTGVTGVQAVAQLTELLISQDEARPLLSKLADVQSAVVASAQSLIQLANRIQSKGLPADLEPFTRDGQRASSLMGNTFTNMIEAWVKRSPQAAVIAPQEIFSDPRFQGLLQQAGVQPGATIGQVFVKVMAMPHWLLILLIAAAVAAIAWFLWVLSQIGKFDPCKEGQAIAGETVETNLPPGPAYDNVLSQVFVKVDRTAEQKEEIAKWVDDQIKGAEEGVRKMKLERLAEAIRKS